MQSPPNLTVHEEKKHKIALVSNHKDKIEVNASLDMTFPQIAMGNETVRNYAHFWNEKLSKFEKRSNSTKPFRIK